MPPVCSHVIEQEVLAWVGFVASNHHWEEETVVDHHILQSDISEGDSGLGCAGSFRVEGVEHASGAISIRLFHLLGADVDCPPMRSLHCYILVPNVLHDPIPFIPRVSLDINPLPWPFHHNVLEGYVPDAVHLLVGRDTSDGNSYTQDNGDVLHKHVVCTVPVQVLLMPWLRHNHVIPALHRQVIDVEVGAMGIDSIRIEREHRDDSHHAE